MGCVKTLGKNVLFWYVLRLSVKRFSGSVLRSPRSAGFDVLGDILSGSNIMNMKSDNVIIKPDGRWRNLRENAKLSFYRTSGRLQ